MGSKVLGRMTSNVNLPGGFDEGDEDNVSDNDEGDEGDGDDEGDEGDEGSGDDASHGISEHWEWSDNYNDDDSNEDDDDDDDDDDEEDGEDDDGGGTEVLQRDDLTEVDLSSSMEAVITRLCNVSRAEIKKFNLYATRRERQRLLKSQSMEGEGFRNCNIQLRNGGARPALSLNDGQSGIDSILLAVWGRRIPKQLCTGHVVRLVYPHVLDPNTYFRKKKKGLK